MAVSVTGWLKRLPFLVSDAIHFAAQILLTCKKHSTGAVFFTAASRIDVGNLRIKLGEEGEGEGGGGWMQGDTTEENERERGKDTGADLPTSGYVVLWENQASLLRTEEPVFQPL